MAGGKDVARVDVGVEHEVDMDAEVVQGASSQGRRVISWVGQITQEVS